ncbi:hypothetical protein F2Q68_00035895 [Brassica cretica]|uniref:No apical meristem-associated C-terminal domain-containing protein n=1 Tax=Brassica cretica TaxID=69181 RepID=A0A8S9H1W5_BRACR|nr:hypothetical protein F2Q68_00035895 [Brassica cretica]
MNLPATLSVDLLEDEKPPYLSRRLTSMKNHFTSFSGPELSSTKLKRKMDGWIKRQKSKVNVGKEVQCNRAAWIKVDEEGSSKQRSAFAGAIHVNVFILLRVVELASSKANEEDSADDDEGTNHPPGVKAAKSCSKKTMVDEKELCEFQIMWSIKKQNLALKERLSKIKLLDNLIAKQGPLADYEEALKKKLINELMSN